MPNPQEITVVTVPNTLLVPPGMQEAHERLLSVFRPEDPPQVKNLQAMVRSPDSEIIVAVASETPPTEEQWPRIPSTDYLGTLSLLYLTTLTRTVAHIEHVAVDPHAQGLGIGRQLVAAALETGHAHGVTRFDLTSAPSKIAAQALYERLGFKRRDTNNWRYET